MFEKGGNEADGMGSTNEYGDKEKKESESSGDEEESKLQDDPKKSLTDTSIVNPTQLNVDNDAPALGVKRENSRTQSLQAKYPKTKNKISCLLGEEDEALWINVGVMKKGGKSMARNEDYFNVKYNI